MLRTVKVRLKESGLVALSSGQERGRIKNKIKAASNSSAYPLGGQADYKGLNNTLGIQG